MCKLVFLALSVIFLSNKKGQANYFMSVMIMVPSCLFVGVCVVFLFFVCVCFFFWGGGGGESALVKLIVLSDDHITGVPILLTSVCTMRTLSRRKL